MKLHITIETHDSKLDCDLFEAAKVSASQEKAIADGISIQLVNYLLREEVDFPTILNVIAYTGQNVVSPFAISILSSYLYDKLAKRRDNKLTINNKSVEINIEKIEQLITNIANEEKDDMTLW